MKIKKCKCGSVRFSVEVTGTQIYDSELEEFDNTEIDGCSDIFVCINCGKVWETNLF